MGNTRNISVRVDEKLLYLLDLEAAKNKRSRSAELIYRLDRSFGDVVIKENPIRQYIQPVSDVRKIGSNGPEYVISPALKGESGSITLETVSRGGMDLVYEKDEYSQED